MWFGLLLDTGMVVYALAACTVAPQATLLYWLSNNAFFLGLQNALARPSVVKALNLPAVMLPHPKHDKDARGGSRRVFGGPIHRADLESCLEGWHLAMTGFI
jgi:hypothetical protein